MNPEMKANGGPRSRRLNKARQNRGRKSRVGDGFADSGRSNVIPAKRTRNRAEITELFMPVFPSRSVHKLRYSTNFGLTGTVGTVASYVFAANGLFDPDITGTGHQPMGFDQLILSYNHYVVTHARILCTFRNLATTAVTVAITAQANNTPITVIDQILESGLLTTTTLTGSSASESIQVLECRMDVAKFLGRQFLEDDGDTSGTATTNPLEIEYFHVQSWDTVTNNTAVKVDCIIEYTAIFLEPRILTESLKKTFARMMLQEQKSLGRTV